MPDQIFISYRRDDAAYVTGHINDLLRQEFGAESVFTDVDNIALGVDFRKVLDESVSQCQVFLAVIGDHWLTMRDQAGQLRLEDPADFVRIEIESALKRNIPIIPLLVGRAQMPKAEELPESLRDLAFRNGTPIRPAPDFGADMDRLIRNLRRYLETIREHANSEQESAPAKARADSPSKSAAAEKTYTGKERRSAPRQSFVLGEDESAHRRAELGFATGKPKRRTGALVFLVALVAIAAGGWYYADQNPEQVQSIVDSVTGSGAEVSAVGVEEPAVGSPAATERGTEPGVGAPTSFGAPTVTITEEQVPAVADEITAEPDAPLTADAAIEETADEAEAQEPVATPEPVEAAAETVADTTAEEPAGMVDGEVILTPGTQRQADVSGLISEGVSLAAVDDHEAAIQHFSDALALDTEAAFVYRQRAASYQALGRHEAAIADYDEAIRINAEDVNAHYRRGASNIALGDHAAAVLDYDAVILLDPEFADAYSRRADAHEVLGNTAQAAQDRATAAVFESNRQN